MARAGASGIRLTHDDARVVKGMLARGDRHHDIAAWFGVNQGRIAEVRSGDLHPGTQPAPEKKLPPPGPYMAFRAVYASIAALESARTALDNARSKIDAALETMKIK